MPRNHHDSRIAVRMHNNIIVCLYVLYYREFCTRVLQTVSPRLFGGSVPNPFNITRAEYGFLRIRLDMQVRLQYGTDSSGCTGSKRNDNGARPFDWAELSAGDLCVWTVQIKQWLEQEKLGRGTVVFEKRGARSRISVSSQRLKTISIVKNKRT